MNDVSKSLRTENDKKQRSEGDCLTRLSSTKWYGNRHVPLKCRIWIAFRSKKSRLSSTLGDMLIFIKSVSICISFFMEKHLICWGQGFLFWNILCFFPNSGYVQFGEQDLIEEACKLSETTKCVHVKPITFPQKIYKKEVPYTQKTILSVTFDLVRQSLCRGKRRCLTCCRAVSCGNWMSRKSESSSLLLFLLLSRIPGIAHHENLLYFRFVFNERKSRKTWQ